MPARWHDFRIAINCNHFDLLNSKLVPKEPQKKFFSLVLINSQNLNKIANISWLLYRHFHSDRPKPEQNFGSIEPKY